MAPKKALTIAGSDCSGGAGMQADLKTFQERDVYGMNVVTVLVAMDPADWSHKVWPVDLDIIRTQFKTFFPNGVGCDAVKTGMLPTVEIIQAVGEMLMEAKMQHVVLDPVMVCKGTKAALFPENTQAMIDSLLPLAEVVTPNTFEAIQLAGMEDITTEEDMLTAAKIICDKGAKAVALKAARIFPDAAVNMLYDGKEATWIRMPKIKTTWTHGAGCSFSACMTAELAKDADIHEAFKTATAFVQAGLEEGFPINPKCGPIYHKALSKR